ncbi:MAG TPA: acyl-CoA dehydrogenase family protein [Stellaceae bacterium]|nr:acyl-CoA dehydrogenase family protein [Stellaceae bacterium]
MDFEDTHEEAAFRMRVRQFLDAHAERRASGAPQGYRTGQEEPGALPRAKAWQALKARHGFAALSWPLEWGGAGASPIEQVIYAQEESNYQVPRGFFEIGLGMCIPTLCTWGSAAQRERFTGPAIRGEEIWCQLFSEPAAGSDLAGLKTRARADGDHWVINGQKIWTSGAHYADWGIIVTRTDPTLPKHEGLTFFFLDMKSPGIEVRPIKQISGASHFNEVYFTDVRVPDQQRLGKVGDGWRVSLTTLMNERLAVGEAPGPDFTEIFALVRATTLDEGPALDNAAIRDKLADWYVRAQGLKYTKFRTMTALSRGATPGPEASIGKLVSASKLQEIAAFGMDLLGMRGLLMEPDEVPMKAFFQQALLYSPALRIAGGTDEILRNIIAERVLGLPADPRPDKGVPFNQIPTGKR